MEFDDKSPTSPFIIGEFIIIGVFILTVLPQESLGVKLIFTKPIFAGTELGNKCSEIWDSVQAIKAELRKNRQEGKHWRLSC